MEVFELDVSRRCPQPICDLAEQTPLLHAKRMTRATERPGRKAVKRARTPFDEAAFVADRVEFRARSQRSARANRPAGANALVG